MDPNGWVTEPTSALALHDRWERSDEQSIAGAPARLELLSIRNVTDSFSGVLKLTENK